MNKFTLSNDFQYLKKIVYLRSYLIVIINNEGTGVPSFYTGYDI